MNKLWLLAMLLGIALLGCQLSQEADADPAAYNLNEVFTLRGGHEATINAANLRLRFTELLEDSRCPTQVDCFWTGQARIAIRVEQGQAEPKTVEFNTNPAPGQNRQTVGLGEFQIQLQSLDPYPDTPDEEIAFEDYAVTLLVRKAP